MLLALSSPFNQQRQQDKKRYSRKSSSTTTTNNNNSAHLSPTVENNNNNNKNCNCKVMLNYLYLQLQNSFFLCLLIYIGLFHEIKIEIWLSSSKFQSLTRRKEK